MRSFNLNFGEKIKFIRKQHGIRQADLAKKMGINVCTLSSLESKRRHWKKVRYSTLEALAVALNVDIQDLMGEPNE